MQPKDSAKPAKPYAGFPLFPHTCGSWCKKIRGRLVYFGPWRDWQAALNKFLAERDDLFAGRTPRPQALTVRDLCNRFLTTKRLAVEAGEMSPHTWGDYYKACVRLRDALGGHAADQLVGADFEQYRARLAKTRGPAALAAEVQRVRSVFTYAFKEGLIERPARFGTGFHVPPRRAMRKARREAGPKFFDAGECRRLIDGAGDAVRAMILLALNCGYGQSDLGGLPRSALDLAHGWADYPRPKTEASRRAKLWPETVAAVKAALEHRPDPRDPDDADRVFLTKFGRPWTRTKAGDPAKPETGIDVIGLEFRRLLKRLGMFKTGRSFYSLRRTFRTVADETGDQRAADLVMGHASEHISATYVQGIADHRLERIAAAVRKWLWPKGRRDSC